MTKTIITILVFVLLVIMFVAPVRTALNNLSRRDEVREEELIGTVSTFNPKVKEIQRILYEAGYEPGLIDGAMGEKTRSALKLLQEAHGLKISGWIDEATLEALYAVRDLIEEQKTEEAQFAAQEEPVEEPQGKEQPATEEAPAGISTRQAQEVLKARGYYTGPIDGKIGKQTAEAIRKFQKAEGLKEDGVLGTETKKRIASYL